MSLGSIYGVLSPKLSASSIERLMEHIHYVCWTVASLCFAGAALASCFLLSNSVPMYLSMYVWTQDLLVRLSCRQQQTKNSLHHRLSMSTAWRQPIVRVSRNVSCRIVRVSRMRSISYHYNLSSIVKILYLLQSQAKKLPTCFILYFVYCTCTIPCCHIT